MSDDWDSYFGYVEDELALLMVDLGMRPDVPIAGLTEVVWLRLYMLEPRDDGLSGEREFKRLIEVEEGLSEAISADPTIAYVGAKLSAGHCDFYFYCENSHAAQNVLSSAMILYAEYEFETGARSDPDWSAYLECIYPSSRNRHMILNKRVRASLKSHGDKHEIERLVRHWVYFKSPDDRSRFLNAAIVRGYEGLKQRDNGGGDRPFVQIVGRINTVDAKTIDRTVLELFDLAGDYEGDYDGWETSVETTT